MPNSTSTRFRKAAETERRRLLLRHARLERKADEHRAALRQLETELGALDQRVWTLNGLLGEPAAEQSESPSASAAPELSPGSKTVLSGREIRETAVRLLVERGQGEAPIHYREWLGFLEEAGYAVSGQRPDAVFLNQIVRSPLVKGGTKAGVYHLDLEVPKKLSAELQALEEKHSELALISAENPADHAELSDAKNELDLKIKRTQRSLKESLTSSQGSSSPTAQLKAA